MLDDPLEQAVVLPLLAEVSLQRGKLERAVELTESALRIWRAPGDPWGIARTQHRLARIAQGRADHAAAEPFLREALALQREILDPQGLTLTLISLAQAALAAGDARGAGELLREGLTLAHHSGDRMSVVRALEEVALQMARDQPEPAMQLMSAALAQREVLFARAFSSEQERLDRSRRRPKPTSELTGSPTRGQPVADDHRRGNRPGVVGGRGSRRGLNATIGW